MTLILVVSYRRPVCETKFIFLVPFPVAPALRLVPFLFLVVFVLVLATTTSVKEILRVSNRFFDFLIAVFVDLDTFLWKIQY